MLLPMGKARIRPVVCNESLNLGAALDNSLLLHADLHLLAITKGFFTD